ncbi:LOW QUALITY PROTEIN: hypothetical protein HID58_093579 [Brassica napus]|uniref:Allantoinase composite domain-containing protein n=1 Tax=Brassica napus TaxID=3708 RepID=A0ABQ7XAE8_BRANA|nr:LOW QUALITY PROTEIN: hypothetical protein HID58_093579 [Brassica napus]
MTGSEMALINLEAHVLLLSGGFVVLMLQSKLLFIQPDWNLTMTMEVNGGIIVSVVKEEDWFKKQRSRVKVIDYGESVIMPGLVDTFAGSFVSLWELTGITSIRIRRWEMDHGIMRKNPTVGMEGDGVWRRRSDDRQRGVANLFKEKGVDVVERFTDDGVYGAAELGDPSKSQALLASIRNLISSPAPLHFSLKSIPLKKAKLLMTLKD